MVVVAPDEISESARTIAIERVFTNSTMRELIRKIRPRVRIGDGSVSGDKRADDLIARREVIVRAVSRHKVFDNNVVGAMA